MKQYTVVGQTPKCKVVTVEFLIDLDDDGEYSLENELSSLPISNGVVREEFILETHEEAYKILSTREIR